MLEGNIKNNRFRKTYHGYTSVLNRRNETLSFLGNHVIVEINTYHISSSCLIVISATYIWKVEIIVFLHGHPIDILFVQTETYRDISEKSIQ